MRPVDQTRFGENGNCTTACIASLLEMPIDAVPEFGEDSDNAKLNAWLRPFGLYAVTLSGPQEANGVPWYPTGYHMLGGQTIDGPHHVIAFGSAIVHDPNPSPNHAGLVTREDCTILVPFDPARGC